MMTNHELIDSKARLTAELAYANIKLTAAIKQITNLTAILMNAQLGPNTAASLANIRSIHLDSMAEIFKCGNQTCPVTIKISQYSIKRRRALQWYGDPFYTHNKGYKMCLRVDAAGFGDGKGTHLSASLFLMKGPHDNELTWPLRGKFEMKLLNQISDSEHHSRTVTYSDTKPAISASRVTEGNRSDNGWGIRQYICNENVNKITPRCQFLKDDCLFFQVAKL